MNNIVNSYKLKDEIGIFVDFTLMIDLTPKSCIEPAGFNFLQGNDIIELSFPFGIGAIGTANTNIIKTQIPYLRSSSKLITP